MFTRHNAPDSRVGRAFQPRLRARARIALGFTCAIAAGCATSAPAALMPIDGTVSLDFLALGTRPSRIAGVGVASVNVAGANIALRTLGFEGGLTGTAVVPVSDPEVSATIGSIRWDAALGSGSLTPFSHNSPFAPWLANDALPLRGTARLCLVFAGCGSSQLLFPFSQGPNGIGVGGTILPTPAGIAISVEAAPWTVGPTFVPVVTDGGATVSIASSGFLHGPYSFSESAALPGGAVKLVTPVVVYSDEGLHPLSSFASVQIRFLPEPEVGLLVAIGLAGLVALGRRRVRP